MKICSVLQMKGAEYFLIVAGILLVWYLSSRTQETFVPEYLDQADVKRTAERSSSSYEQRTNHAVPTPYDNDPIPGIQTPFRVNMFNSHML
jgi:hypothetical protein